MKTQRYAGTVNGGEMIRSEVPATGCISAPTLILHARDDALVSYRHAENAHQAIANSRLVLFEAGGHGLLSRMGAVRSTVNDFLRRLWSRRSPMMPIFRQLFGTSRHRRCLRPRRRE